MVGTEIKYQPERTRTYLGSPSLLRLPDGALLVTHDYFGRGCPRTHEGEEGLTSVYRSEDDGRSWTNVTHVMNSFWASLFAHRGAVYLFGTSAQYGGIVIRRSDDGGLTWTHPIDERSGLLFAGGPFHDPPNYHCAPVPVVEHEGRLYRAFEDCTPLQWGTGFQACVVSAAADADLLDAASWTMSNKLAFGPAWLPEEMKHAERPGWLEGNVVAGPDGAMWNVLRLNSRPVVDRAAMVRVTGEGKRIEFDPERGFIHFPGGMSKFTIRRDPKTGLYLSLVNDNTDPAHPAQRNVLSLSVSTNLRDWRVVKRLVEDDSGLSHEDSIRLTGFQYVDWQFDGDDILYVVRTAHRGAVRYHDANRITFHVLRGYAGALS